MATLVHIHNLRSKLLTKPNKNNQDKKKMKGVDSWKKKNFRTLPVFKIFSAPKRLFVVLNKIFLMIFGKQFGR